MPYTPSPALPEAAAYLSSASSLAKVSNTTKLEVDQLYGLYKYLTAAPAPPNPRPSLFDLTGRAKWDAWNHAGQVYAGNGPDAEQRYLAIARELGWVPGAASGASGSQSEGEVWDEDLGMSVPASAMQDSGGMGVSVSTMAVPMDKGDDADTGGQVLHDLAIQGDADKIDHVLAEHSAMDVNQLDEHGYTALHLACDRGSLPVVKVLIKHGADPTIKDPDDLTGVELARIAGHDEICTFLQTVLH